MLEMLGNVWRDKQLLAIAALHHQNAPRAQEDGADTMPNIGLSAVMDWTAYWTACVTLEARDENKRTDAIAALMRLALHEANTVGGLAAEELMERFSVRVMMV